MRRIILWRLVTTTCIAVLAIICLTSCSSTSRNYSPTSSESSPSSSKPTQPDQLLKQYFSFIEGGQFDSMYDMLTSTSQEQITRNDFIERNSSVYSGVGARNITITINSMYDVVESPGNKLIVYSLRMDTVAGEIAHDNIATFELSEDNEYRLQWHTNILFPELSQGDRVRVRVLPAERGNIFDRNGTMLAGPGTASAVGFVPGRMRREEADDTPELETTFIYNEDDIARVAELLDMTPEGVMRRLNASYVRDDIFVQLRIISRDAQELIEELLTVQGIMISTAHVRYYPLGRSAAHLVGYIQNINAEELEALRDYGYHMNSIIGRAGLESIYESTLRAIDGREIFILDSDGNRTATLAHKPPINGNDIRLTIDANIQRQLYEVFAGDNSASVATNPITGEVLALVSTPSYDPNDFARGMTTSIWVGLNEDENLPLFNRFRATFSPGSTMKALTAAIGVDGGFFCPHEDFGRSGLRWQQDESWGGFFITTVREYDGAANLNNAMAWSDNIYFAKATLRVGASAFESGLRGLGFNERIPFEYGLFSSTISRTGNFSSEIQLADSGYGQGEILVNPVHLAAIYAAFITQGDIMMPRLTHNIANPPQVWIPGAFSPETARVVLDSLIFSVEYGTGRNARIPGTPLAGKTGTAEIKLTQDDVTGRELGWFVLLTADENAQNPLLVVSMVEDVQGRGGSGYVVPRVRQIFDTNLK